MLIDFDVFTLEWQTYIRILDPDRFLKAIKVKKKKIHPMNSLGNHAYKFSQIFFLTHINSHIIRPIKTPFYSLLAF